MSILRNRTQNEIIAILDASLFSKEAFDVSFNNKNEEIVRIIYKDNPTFKFIIKSSSGFWRSTECPGVIFSDDEAYSDNDFLNLKGRIKPWTMRLLEEITISEEHVPDVIKRMRQDLERDSENLPDPDLPFGPGDASQWRSKLDDLVAQIEKLAEKGEIQQGEVKKLKAKINELKKRIESVPKKTWLKSAGHRVINVMEQLANTKAGRDITEQVIKQLIGPSNT